MIQHQVYQCPKCYNTLLVSNKMLHDLRCTEENPATYEKVLYRQSKKMPMDYDDDKPNSSKRFSSRMSIQNEDGKSIDIVREKSIRGKEELMEIKYDPSGNIISRKKADYFIPENDDDEDEDEDEEEDDNNEDNIQNNYDNNNSTYYEVNNDVEVRKAPNIIYETAEAEEIIYEAPAQYAPHVTVHKPIEETIIMHNGGMSDGIIDNIIRNTMSQNTNNNGYEFNQNYSQTNNINNINMNIYNNQNFDINNFNNQINYQNNNNNIYNNSSQIKNNLEYSEGDILRKTAGMGSMNYNSYNYQ